MPTSYSPPSAGRAQPAAARRPLRLRMRTEPGLDTLDGGWWPRSRDLAVELTDLADHFPDDLGRLQHASYSPPDWDPTGVPRVPVRGGYVDLEVLPQDDTHVMLLRTSRRATLRVLVVPVEFTSGQGEEALLAAATSGYTHSAGCLLHTVTDQVESNPDDYWT